MRILVHQMFFISAGRAFKRPLSFVPRPHVRPPSMAWSPPPDPADIHRYRGRTAVAEQARRWTVLRICWNKLAMSIPSNCLAASAWSLPVGGPGGAGPGPVAGGPRPGRSQDPQFRIEGAGILDGLEDGHHIPGGDAQIVEHFRSLPTVVPGCEVEGLDLLLLGGGGFAAVAPAPGLRRRAGWAWAAAGGAWATAMAGRPGRC